MLKDRAQKALALRMCVSKRWAPYLEVDVDSAQRLDARRSLLTDIDVLAVAQSPIGQPCRYIFDCKSGARESAISRAFWLSGVMTRLSVDHGFVILNKKINISNDHRASARDLAVTLVHEPDFESLASGMQATTGPIDSSVSDIDAWEHFIDSHNARELDQYMVFSRSEYWMLRDPGERLRKIVARLRAINSELDPARPRHFAIFADALSLLLLAVSELTSSLFLVLLRPATQEAFSGALLAALYGGVDRLAATQRVRHLVSGHGPGEGEPLFPELPRLERLVREMLQAPREGLHASLLAREIGFSRLQNRDTRNTQSTWIREAPYAAKFIVLASDFIRRACRLPPDFDIQISDHVLPIASV